jgi:hypothetical protein
MPGRGDAGRFAAQPTADSGARAQPPGEANLSGATGLPWSRCFPLYRVWRLAIILDSTASSGGSSPVAQSVERAAVNR